MKRMLLLLVFLSNAIAFNGSTVSMESNIKKTIIVMGKCKDQTDANHTIRTKKECPLVYLQDGTLEVYVANFRGLLSVEILDEEQLVWDAATRNVDGNFIYVSPAAFDEDHHYRVFVTVNGEKYMGEFDI